MQTSGSTRQMSPAEMAMRRVAEQIGTDMPKGFSGDKYWLMTVETHDAFVDAVDVCRTHDTQANRDAVRQTGSAWRKAWTRAYDAFREDQEA